MKTVVEMAREAGFDGMGQRVLSPVIEGSDLTWLLERFAALVRADERQGAYERRGTLMFNPYTGTPRHPSDVASDPHGILMLDPEQPIRARGETK